MREVLLAANQEKTEKSTESKQTNLTKIIFSSEPLLIAVLPIFGYLIVYMYNLGIMNFYNIPIIFINFDLNQSIKIIFTVTALSVLFYFVFTICKNFASTTSPPMKRYFTTFLPTFIWSSFFYFLFPKSRSFWGIFIICLFTIFIFYFLYILFKKRRVKVFSLRFQEYYQERDIRANKNPSALSKFFNLLGPYLSIFIASLALVYCLGYYSASNKKEYYIVNTFPERIVVWSTNKYSICETFNKSKGVFYKNYIVLNNEKLDGIEFSLERIGPLSVDSSE